MRLKSLMLLLSSIGLVGLWIFGGYAINKSLNERAAARHAVEAGNISSTLSALVHDLQKERGLSAGYLGSSDGGFTSRLDRQRTATDVSLPRAESALHSFKELRGPLAEEAIQSLRELADVRSAVTARSTSLGDMAQYYTGLIQRLLASSLSLSHAYRAGELVLDAHSIANIQQAKEAAGLERAMGANGFGSGNFTPEVYHRFVSLAAVEEARLAAAYSMVSPDVRDSLREILTGPAVTRVEEMRKQAGIAFRTGDFGGITGPEWFSASTERLELLKAMEDYQAAVLRDVALAAESWATHQLIFKIALLLAITGICMLAASMMAGRLVKQYKVLIGQLEAVGRGELQIQITQTERPDEIGDISRALDTLRRRESERQIMEAQRNRQMRADVENARKIRRAVDDFQTATETNLNEMIEASAMLASVSSSLETAVNVTRSGSNEAHSSATMASDAVADVANALDRMSVSVSAITSQLDGALAESLRATSAADRASTRIKQLEKATGAITTAAQIIADIAGQTNLLALNATIEAERAGSAGRGFAIVASEVKTLAEDTARATEDISAQINDIQKETNEVVGGIADVLKTCNSLQETAGVIQAAMTEQREATSKIALNIHELSGGSTRASELAARVLKAADTSSQDAQKVRSAAGGIDNLSRRLRQEVGDFLRTIAAA